MFYKVVVYIVQWVFRLFYKIELEGTDDLPEGPLVICSNHISALDPIFLAIVLRKRKIQFLAKKELFENPILRWILNRLDVLPVDREGDSLAMVRNTLSTLKEGGTIGMYPEGIRVKEVDPQNIKEGIGLMAYRGKAKVQTFHIEYPGRALLRKRVVLRNTGIVDPEKYRELELSNKDKYREITLEIYHKMYGE